MANPHCVSGPSQAVCAPGRIEILGSLLDAFRHFSPPLLPACRPLRRRSDLPLQTSLSPGSSQSSLKNRTLLPLLQPATLRSRLLKMIPILFPSLAYSGLSLSLSLSIKVFLHPPPRFSTRTELILNGLTIFAAVAAGAAQVCFFCFICYIHHFLTDGCFR